MNSQVMQTMDLAGASYSAALMGMIGASVLLFLGTGWVREGWKLPVALCGISALVGVFSIYEARAAWLTAGQVPLVYHYVGWVVSMPVQVLALFYYARQMGRVSVALFWRFVVVSILMVVVRYIGEAGYMHATLSFSDWYCLLALYIG